MALPNETELAAAIAEGDLRAIGQLLKGMERRIYNVCLGMLGSREEAADGAGDAMLKMIDHMHDFHGQASTEAWVMRIVMNLCLAQLRQSKARMSESLEGLNGGDDQTAELREQVRGQPQAQTGPSVQQGDMGAQLHTALSRV